MNLLGSQRVKPSWDWAEAVLLGESSASFFSAFDRTATTLEQALSFPYQPGTLAIADARATGVPDDAAGVWFTDPPYYDAIPYAALSDFFLVWLKRIPFLRDRMHDPLDPQNPLSNKADELVVDEIQLVSGTPKDKSYFERGMASAFSESRRTLHEDGIGCVVFAHKTTEGWEALLSGLIRGGWLITASWPLATEMAHRPRARESAALATSVHLVCRPRPDDAKVGDWADVLRELPTRVGGWMERLQGEGVRGADLVFACIGPALEIFSRYARVESADGREVVLAEYLEKVWEVVGRSALAQVLGTAEAKAHNGAAGAVEEDARLTALFLWTLQSTVGDTGADGGVRDDEADGDDDGDDDGDAPRRSGKSLSLVYDVARRFAQPLGIHLEDWEGRVIEIEKGVVRLIPVSERSKQLFGEDGASAVARDLERSPKGKAQLNLRVSVHREHPFRSIVNAHFGIVNTENGIVNSRFGIVNT